MPSIKGTLPFRLLSHRSKSTVPGKGVIITNCAKVRPACFAKAAVAAKVSLRSEGSPKMNDPSTCTPCSLKVLSRVTKSSPAELKSGQSDGIEVIVGERDEAKSETP